MTVGRFVDAEQLAIVWLRDHLPGVSVGTKVPAGEGIRVTRSPGSNDQATALPRVDVECFAPDRVRMWILAGQANNAFSELAGDTVALQAGDPDDPETEDWQVDDVNTVTDPVPAWWSNTIERSIAVYELDIRAQF